MFPKAIPTLLVLSTLTAVGFSKLHNVGACIKDRKFIPSDGYNYYSTEYTILPDATECACNYYKARNTGRNQWDQCPDCTFDGLRCNSAAWHIGGDELHYYCVTKCGAEESVAN